MEFSKPFAEMSYKGLVYMTAPTIPFKHCFTTRWGGVSEGYLESLNLGENRGDKDENVRENYRLVLEALGIPPQNLCFTKQVHKNEVRIVTDTDRRELFSPFAYEADGIVSSTKGLPLICFTADCIPVLLCDPDAGVAGAIHCGWRSTVADILGQAVARMTELGANAGNIRAAVGPGIDMCCYETGPEVPEAIKKLIGHDCDGLFFEVPGTGKYMVDLKETDRRRLIQLGLKSENISVSDECTSCNCDKYWSHRRTKGERGSQAAIIVVG
ncbi:MAG: peptidoglycan editing factor PgeF [Clostridiales bacterium]|nr:peptidoglycan editing factor PgeF [Clostridiales bacterium]